MLKILLVSWCITIYVECIALPKNDLSSNSSVCTTDVCAEESAKIAESLNDNIDPCENFYDFVCDKYIHDTVLPDDQFKETSFSLAQNEINRKLQTALFEDVQSNEPRAFKLAKTFTQLCMDEATLNQKGVQPMLDILERYGGWPVVEGEEWESDDWNWLKMLKNMSNDGLPANFIFGVTIEIDQNDTSKYAIKIGRSELGLDRDLLLRDINDTNVKAYLEFMIDVAVIFGANRTRAEIEMIDVLNFEIKLAQIQLEFKQKYLKLTLKEIPSFFSSLNWVDFVNSHLHGIYHVNENETVMFIDPFYLFKLQFSMKKRTTANYLAWRLIRRSEDFLSANLYQRHQQFSSSLRGTSIKSNSRSLECVEQTIEFFPIAAAAIYVRRFFDGKSRETAVDIAMKIHKQFIETLKQVTWMDEKSRMSAIEKANAMKFQIGYPDELMNDSLIDEYYNDLELQTDSFFHSMLRIRKFLEDRKIMKFRKTVKKNDWIEFSLFTTSVNAAYYQQENSILFTAAILQDRFFSADRPFYMNYGTIGLFIGHEITHGFDNEGRRIDSMGNVINWWQSDTLDKFRSKAQCFIDQYSNYSNPALNITIRGEKTQDENIADNGGIKVAYAAYQKYVEENGAEPVLPGLNYTANQLFWISAARILCSVTRPEYEKIENLISDHTPHEYRIIGSLSNSKRFSHDFNCKVDSAMNPTNKCEIW